MARDFSRMDSVGTHKPRRRQRSIDQHKFKARFKTRCRIDEIRGSLLCYTVILSKPSFSHPSPWNKVVAGGISDQGTKRAPLSKVQSSEAGACGLEERH